MRLNLTQADMAVELDISPRQYQNLEAGRVPRPRPSTLRAIEALVARIAGMSDNTTPGRGPLRGIWHSRCQYPSSSAPGTMFVGANYVVLDHQGEHVTITSLPDGIGAVSMKLDLEGQILTGTWRVQTSPEHHYAGEERHGAIQLVVGATGRDLVGAWCGYGRDYVVNTGAWTLEFITPDTDPATLTAWSKPSPDDSARPKRN
jgi:hypothetical protein